MSNRLAYLNTTYGRFMVEKVERGLHYLSDDDWKKLTNNPDTLCITIDEFNRVINSSEEFIFVNERTIGWYNGNLLYVRDNPFDFGISNPHIPIISTPERITPRRKEEFI